MRRADRLFQIVQLLRRDRLSTAQKLAAELRVSERTIYRDIQDLLASGVPIESEAGVGYRLTRRFDLPPLMFTVEEMEALLAGIRFIQTWGDPAFQIAARSVACKVESVVPPEIRARLAHSEIHAPEFMAPAGASAFMGELRRALREQRNVRMRYRRADGLESERTVHPLGLFFWGFTWSLATWCELRGGFRVFRLDRILDLEVGDPFDSAPGRTLKDYLRAVNAETTEGARQGS